MLAGYVRVSTDDQSTEMQVAKIREWCKAHKHTLLTVFPDEAKSGRTMERPAFKAMLESARFGGFQGIVVYKTDRLWRNAKDALDMITQLGKSGISLYSVTDQRSLDRLTPSDKLQSTVMVAVAEYERDVIVERVKDGKANAMAKGHYVSKPPFGYKVVNHKLVMDEENAQIVRLIIKDKENKMPWRQLAKKYNRRVSSLQRIVNNPIYRTGEIRLNGKIVGNVEKII